MLKKVKLNYLKQFLNFCKIFTPKMFGRFLHRIFGNIAHNEQVIDKLAESKAIKRAAQVTAYYMVKASDTAQRKLIEYERSSDGFKRIKDVLKTIQEESNKKRIN